MTPKEIQELRMARGWTQGQLGKQIGVSQGAVSNWEAGRTHPRPEQAVRLAAILRPAGVPDASDSPPGSDYATWVADQRGSKGLTRRQLAERAGLSQMQVYNIETGRTSNPRPATRQALAKVLGSPPSAVTRATEEAAQIADVGEMTEFDPHATEEVPTDPGVYVFYDISDRPIYVGEASSIRKRVSQHAGKFWFKRPIVETAAYVRVDNERLRRQLEQTLIKFMRSNAVINKKGVDRSE